MKILYCAIDQQVPGAKGGSIHVRAVADGLAALGHEVHVAAQPGPEGFPDDSAALPRDAAAASTHASLAASEGEALRASGVVRWHAIAAPFGNPQLRLAQVGRVKSLARTVAPDIVIERYHNFGGEGLLAARAVGVPAVLEVNAPVVDYPGSPKRRLDRLLLVEPMRRWREWQCRQAALIVSPTRAILPAWLPSGRVLEAEWGADTDRFHPDAAGPLPFSPDDRLTIAFVGAFRAWHGVHHLVQAMRELRARGRREFRAVLIGDGPELPRARALAEGLDTVTFTGALPHDQVAACLAASDIGAAPFDLAAHAPLSLTFYWSPLKIFEYMASGLPVVAPDIPRLRRIVEPGVTGLLYDAERLSAAPAATDSSAAATSTAATSGGPTSGAAALATTLESLTDASLRARLGAAARDRAVQRFSWTSHCRLLDEALRRVATGDGDSRDAHARHRDDTRSGRGARNSGRRDSPNDDDGHDRHPR